MRQIEFMPLITSSSDKARAEIIGHAQTLASHLAAAASRMDAITGAMLALGDDDLAEFANGIGPVEIQTVLTRHAESGAAINSALAQANATLSESGLDPVPGGVDVRPLSDKLAEQFRTLDFDPATGTFTVTRIPQPEPEPQPE